MEQLLSLLLNTVAGSKAEFSFAVFQAISKVATAQDKTAVIVDLAYGLLPAKYKKTMTEDELKSAVKAYVSAWQATEKLFK